MDAYLESLVRKDEIAEDVVSEIDEVADAESNLEDEAVVDAAAVESTEPEELTEPVETESTEPSPEEPAQPEEVEPEPTPSKPAVGLKEGDIVAVQLIKVYKTPDVNQIAKNVTGNVTYLGKIGDFNIISYMRHGFGAIKGYTLNDLK